MPRTEDAARDSSNATLCNHCCQALRIHCGVEVTELSTNKQLSLSARRCRSHSVRSMQDRHLLFQGLPGAHCTMKTGWPWIKDCHRLAKRTHKHAKVIPWRKKVPRIL
jgi:hypothetical protein